MPHLERRRLGCLYLRLRLLWLLLLLNRRGRLDSCGADGLQLFSIGDSARWVYLLPRRMTPGRSTLDVQAVDKLGNVSAVDARGRDRIVFYVTR